MNNKQILKKLHVYRMWKNNVKRQHFDAESKINLLLDFDNFQYMISVSFDWSKTQEGVAFWTSVRAETVTYKDVLKQRVYMYFKSEKAGMYWSLAMLILLLIVIISILVRV